MSDNKQTVLFEVCVDSFESCVEAIKGGAGRLELCSSLFLGGLTPSYGMMKVIKDKLPHTVPIHVLIRPRAGDFLYNDIEMEIMERDILIAKELGYEGVVIGILLSDGSIDVTRTKQLASLASPMSVTFHRAFDMCNDYKKGFNDLLSIDCIDRILTSGLESSVLEGIDVIKDLIEMSNNTRIKILPGGGINERNLAKIIKKTKTNEIHTSGRVTQDSAMTFRNNRAFMGGELRASEYTLSIVNHKKIETFRNISSHVNN
ncbi:hypothetical protein CYY_007684 [Polysphondylium violaceum]|uniref:Copper homeostasis protein cutC homolog n=1 Tax=Polysphondylium violaceum TaxID=133409 RepID=A0A8J4PPA3_9MYCE|nr:hypothetical protein CYY_007684 [Polysphondylium violaceum]